MRKGLRGKFETIDSKKNKWIVKNKDKFSFCKKIGKLKLDLLNLFK